ncbi:MAG: bifunctional diaminohydroxyphosphoribosylaminopyrimidine deaminase/5-amino-6-(5-phosphoribosylamino)uracil reductase RibD [Pseudarcicella sp.]|nr:bifunctional diaminohydroxyphosphoribosylaminopyrimidine deaminase/5-amino-6-(5-phosphoribosylamino)uracil reductase RibD [Pseudarcicella sp.]
MFYTELLDNSLKMHERFMLRAMQLAELGAGFVSPNPKVGCVIVHKGVIIGEGWHQQYGKCHAEVNAIASVKNVALLSESDVYVTLEPCSHFGKTPPCADLLIKHQVKRVFIGAFDTNPLVGGKGIQKLIDANIEVIKGVWETECREQNKRFFTFIEQKRPYIILKWAETADGFVAKANFEAIQISSAKEMIFSHKLRATEDAIMVGTNTAIYDNPKLNTRLWSGKNPIRIVLDKHLKLHEGLHLLDGSKQTLVYNLVENKTIGSTFFVKINQKDNFLESILNDLYQRNIQSVIVEGGTRLLQSFIDAGLYDEVHRFQSDFKLNEGIEAPVL